MTDHQLEALRELGRRFDAAPAMDAAVTGRLLVVRVDARRAYGDRDWGVSWGVHALTRRHGRWFDRRPDGGEAPVDVDTVKRILEAAPEGAAQPPWMLESLPTDPADARELPFAMSLAYLTASGLTDVLPVRLVWDLRATRQGKEPTMTRNTNITDKKLKDIESWFEGTPEYGQCRRLGVPDFDIDAIESDLALYVEEHAIGDSDGIPEAELVAAIADHTDTRVRLRILWGFWESGGAELDGYDALDGCWESIDCDDQAVDDDGKAAYDRYEMSVITSTFDEPAPDWRIFRFAAADIEDFARTR